MATKTVVSYYCDACLESGREIEAISSHVIAVDDVRVALDFCAKHEAGLVAALRDVALTRGRALRKEDGARPKSTRIATVVCAECGRVCSNGTGLAAHQRAAHGRMVARAS